MKKELLTMTRQLNHRDPGSRKLILRNEVIRQLSRQTLELVVGGSKTTDSDAPGSCQDTTQ
jgi:hypothetical protein